MEVYNTKGMIIVSSLAMFAIMLMILLNGYGCAAAAVLVKTNTTFRCDGRLDECLIKDDLQLEFLMNPYVSRLLDEADHQPEYAVELSKNPNKPVFPPCGGKSPPNCNTNPVNPDNSKCIPKGVFNRCPTS
jgi:hypothetical protein